MNITCLKTLALNILKNGSSETIASGVEVPELDPCSICNEEIFLHILKKSFTVLTCGHIVHRLCLENLRETMFTCPINNCSAEIEIIEKSPLMRAPSQRSMSIDEGSQDLVIFSKNSLTNLDRIVEENSESGIPDSTTSNLPSKRVGEPTDKISSKKQKQTKKESHILKDLIKELSSKDPVKTIAQTESASELNTSPIIFLDLYIKIVNAEDQNKKTNQEIIRCYYDFGKALKDRLNYYKTLHPKQTAKMLVNDEVRNQLSQKVTETTLRKNTEKARKIYKLFNSIGGNDNMIEQLIQRVSISASTISKLSKDNIEHIVVAVIKNKQ